MSLSSNWDRGRSEFLEQRGRHRIAEGIQRREHVDVHVPIPITLIILVVNGDDRDGVELGLGFALFPVRTEILENLRF